MEKIWRVLLTITFLFIMALSSVKAQEQPNIIQTAPPPGFDDLLQPQSTLVDVYVDGAFIGGYTATYTQDYVEFENPVALTNKIEDAVDKTALERMLGARLETNSDKVCLHQDQTDCGFIATDGLAIIFDELSYRVDLFIGKRFRKEHIIEKISYLPLPDAPFSSIHGLSLYAGGSSGDPTNYTFGLNSVYALRNSRLFNSLGYGRGQGLTLNTLAFQYETRKMLYEVGSFGSTALGRTFIAEPTLVGGKGDDHTQLPN